jgi:hypothetical protein
MNLMEACIGPGLGLVLLDLSKDEITPLSFEQLKYDNSMDKSCTLSNVWY